MYKTTLAEGKSPPSWITKIKTLAGAEVSKRYPEIDHIWGRLDGRLLWFTVVVCWGKVRQECINSDRGKQRNVCREIRKPCPNVTPREGVTNAGNITYKCCRYLSLHLAYRLSQSKRLIIPLQYH